MRTIALHKKRLNCLKNRKLSTGNSVPLTNEMEGGGVAGE